MRVNLREQNSPLCGCTDELAANFDSEAEYDSGDCFYDVPVVGTPWRAIMKRM